MNVIPCSSLYFVDKIDAVAYTKPWIAWNILKSWKKFQLENWNSEVFIEWNWHYTSHITIFSPLFRTVGCKNIHYRLFAAPFSNSISHYVSDPRALWIKRFYINPCDRLYMDLCSQQPTMMTMTMMMTSKREPAILITPLAVVMQNPPIVCNWNVFLINKQLSKADEHTNQRTEVIASDSLHQTYWIYRKSILAFHIAHGYRLQTCKFICYSIAWCGCFVATTMLIHMTFYSV